MCREIKAVCSKSITRRIDKLCEQKVELFNVQPGGIQYIAITKLQKLNKAVSADGFFSADDSTTHAPYKYDFTPSGTVRFHEVLRSGSVCKCLLPSSQRRATAVYPKPGLHTVPLSTQCNSTVSYR
jgi:hypothetical protein